MAERSLFALLRADAHFLTRCESSRFRKWGITVTNRGMQALLLHRLGHAGWKARIPVLPALLARIQQHLFAVDIGYQAELGPGVVIVHGFGLVIGNRSRIKGQCILFHGVTLGDRGTEWVGSDDVDGHPTVEWGCMIGAGAKILGPLTIGSNTVVGANAVVIRDVAPNSIVAGVPAKVIGVRPPMDEKLRRTDVQREPAAPVLRMSNSEECSAAADVEFSVIVVSYNTRDLTLRCLHALAPELRDRAAEVIVVDNASQDGSVQAIREAFPNVVLLEQDRNLGFGAANNVVLRQARGRFLLLLNSDALMHPGALAAMQDCLDRNPTTGVVGPRLLNADGSLQRSCWRFPSPFRSWLESLWVSGAFSNHTYLGDYRHWPHDAERTVEFVIGACLLVRREVYERVGGFDEWFFLYAEETDWERRITDAGWQVMFCPEAVVTHLGGASGAQDPTAVNEHFMDGFDKYQLKHHGRLGLFLARMAILTGCLGRYAIWAAISLLPSLRNRARAKMRNTRAIAAFQLEAGVPR